MSEPCSGCSELEDSKPACQRPFRSSPEASAGFKPLALQPSVTISHPAYQGDQSVSQKACLSDMPVSSSRTDEQSLLHPLPRATLPRRRPQEPHLSNLLSRVVHQLEHRQSLSRPSGLCPFRPRVCEASVFTGQSPKPGRQMRVWRSCQVMLAKWVV